MWRREIAGAVAEAFVLTVEPDIRVPLILIRPTTGGATLVVTAVAQAGKTRFLTDRSHDIATLLRAGIGVCLADVRGTGETAASPDGTPTSLAQTEFDLGGSLLGARLKDLRAVLAWLRSRPDVDRGRMAVWGESFAPANPADLFVDEIEFEVAPQIQYRADPAGPHLALLAGLYEPALRAVVARGGLASYQAVLEEAFTYVPMDAIVHSILKRADIADIARALAPRPLLMDRLVNGRNIVTVPDTGAKTGEWLRSRI
jgi:hypothetical protein